MKRYRISAVPLTGLTSQPISCDSPLRQIPSPLRCYPSGHPSSLPRCDSSLRQIPLSSRCQSYGRPSSREEPRNKMNWKSINKPCKKLLISSGGASSGRNNAGRITIWHRGGGSKRLHRNVDLKRDTSSVGIVERIEYDPNRSSKIALIRWTEGVQPNKPKQHFIPSHNHLPGSITTTVTGQFPLSCISANNTTANNSLKDVFISAFASRGLKEVTSLNIPRIAVAGARPAFFAPQPSAEAKTGEEKTFSLSDIRKWNKDSILWEHRSKRKAAVSWRSLGPDMTFDFVNGEEGDEKKGYVKPSGQASMTKDHRAPVSYILASHEMEIGQMVMNYDSSKPSRKQ